MLCHDATLDRLVAVKVLRSDRNDSASRERFVREAQAAAAIQHDNVVTIHHVTNPSDGPPYLVMQYIAGPTLRQQIEELERLPTREAARIAREIADGLSVAHAAQLVHRDIKPANIILDEADGRAKIMDFGLVRITDPSKRARGSGVTLEGISPGTPEYMSPEQIDAPQTVDARTDVYSLGVTLYEMLTGSRPFQGPTHAVLQQVLHDDPQPPQRRNPRIPLELETICLQAMEKDPSARYETAAAMAEDLHRWLNGEAILARPSGSVLRMWRWWKRHAAFANLALTAAILLLATGSAMFWQWRRAEVHLVDARRHREQRDAKAAEAASSRREAASSLRQAAAANGQLLTATLISRLSQDTRFEETGRTFLRGLLSVPDATLAQHAETPLPLGRVADAHLCKAEFLRDLEDWDEAAPHYQQACKLFDRLVAEAPNDLELRQKLATAYQGFGEVVNNLGNPHESLNSYLRAQDARLQLVTAEPDKNNYRLDLANCEIALGGLHFELGEKEQSSLILNLSRRRLRHLQHATSGDRDLLARSQERIAYRELGDVLRLVGDTDAALICY